MRIGIDCTKFDNTKIGGINTYINGLINGFLRLDTDHSFVLYCNKDNNSTLSDSFCGKNISIIEVNPKRKNLIIAFLNRLNYIFLGNSKLWSIFIDYYYRKNVDLFEKYCDILYCPQTLLPLHNLKIPTVLSMHDIQHEHFPEFFTREELKYRRISYKASAYSATLIQASSNFIKKDLLLNFRKVKENQIFVIQEGVDLLLFQKKQKQTNVKERFNLPEKYLFYPAQLWGHKNHLNLLKAIKNLRDAKLQNIALVFTGRKFSAADDIFNFIKENNLVNVKYLGIVDINDLLALYHQAWYLVLPSLFESSSLPVLEAAAAGIPIIASNISSIAEMNQKFKMFLFDPLEAQSIVDSIDCAWSNISERQIHIEHNKKAVLSNDWSIIASQYMDLFEKTIFSK
jgi:glycosyltransferase involved in cell wall biosynthesis